MLESGYEYTTRVCGMLECDYEYTIRVCGMLGLTMNIPLEFVGYGSVLLS